MIPDFQTVMRPVLVYLDDDGPERSTREVIDRIAHVFHVSESERAELIPSGRQRRLDNKVHWALTHLSQAGLLTRPSRGRVRIAELGRLVLGEHTERVDMKVLQQFPEYRAFRSRTKAKSSFAADPVFAEVEDEPASPAELLDLARAENEAAVETELLSRALALDPAGFERLVLAVLQAMGYGRAGSIEHSGKPGDGGIDGIISQDPLGLDRIYLQAKRYAPGHSVQRPDVQQFVGALMSAQGDRGVFLTTSTFSPGAVTEAIRVNARIELIDGTRLAQLMLQHGVGVRARATVVLHEVDEDFFEGV